MDPLTIKVFPGATNLPLWAMQAHGMALDIRYTAGSVEQLAELIAGEHDLAMTLMDNVVAYASGQGEVPVTGDCDLVALLGADDGFSCLAAQRDIVDFAALRGRTVSVDAMTTGLAFLLRRLLARHGVDEREVSFVPVGGVLQRWQAMMAGRHAATMLVTPFELMAASRGIHVLARGSAAVAHYQGNVIAARRRWAAAQAGRVAAFRAAWRAALGWLCEPANREAAIDLLCANMPGLTRPVAAQTCTAFLAPGGFARDGRCRPDAVAGVLELRHAYRPMAGGVPAPETFFAPDLHTAG